MKEQIAMQKILRNRLNDLRAKNPAYSVRAFSKRVGLSAAMLSRVLNGKRKVSKKLADEIGKRLLLDPQERSELLALFPQGKKNSTDEVSPDYLQLTADQYQVVGDWQAFAILGLTEIPGFKNDPAWIAKRLNSSVTEATRMIERLKRLEMLCESEDGTLTRAKSSYRTTDDVLNLSLRKSHYQNLELAKESLDYDALHQRDFSWITFPMDVEKMPEAKTLIRKFQDDLYEMLEKEAKPTEVYRLAMHLFPLTHSQKETKK